MSSIKTAPLSPQETERLFQQASDDVKANLEGTDEEGRRQALRVARSLVASLENPEDAVMRYALEVETWSRPRLIADSAIRWDHNVWLCGWGLICVCFTFWWKKMALLSLQKNLHSAEQLGLCLSVRAIRLHRLLIICYQC